MLIIQSPTARLATLLTVPAWAASPAAGTVSQAFYGPGGALVGTSGNSPGTAEKVVL